jgi:hypothetical protein
LHCLEYDRDLPIYYGIARCHLRKILKGRRKGKCGRKRRNDKSLREKKFQGLNKCERAKNKASK